MLVSLYRTGPLRQRIGKGYVVVGDDPARIIAAVQAAPPALPSVAGAPLTLRTSPRHPGVLWIDTGMIWLPDPGVRTGLRRALAQATAAVARAMTARGGRLVPSAWLDASGGPAWLCGDIHAVEISSETQRELCCNLLRRYVPELIALTGRAAFGRQRVDRSGSQRLADASDHLSTRYLASASPAHLQRVTDSLRRDEGVSRLDLMDVNPLGLPDNVPNVAVRCVDAQLSTADVIAQALLIQAVAMRARQLERDGRRVPALAQHMLNRNRSKAVSGGLATRLEDEPPAGGERGRDRKGPRPPQRSLTGTRERAVALLEEHIPEFQAMRASADELAPATVGLTVAGTHTAAVRNENDLVQLWSRTPQWAPFVASPDRFLADEGLVYDDHISAANRSLFPGAVALAQVYWQERLTPRPPRRPSPPTAPSVGKPGGDNRPPSRPAHRGDPVRLFAALEQDGLAADAVDAAVLGFIHGGGPANLVPALKRLGGDRQKAVRRLLRPARPLTRTTDQLPADWDSGVAAEACRLARENRRALLKIELAGERREAAAATWRAWLAAPPTGIALLLITEATFRSADNTQRLALEFVVLDRAGEGAAA